MFRIAKNYIYSTAETKFFFLFTKFTKFISLLLKYIAFNMYSCNVIYI